MIGVNWLLMAIDRQSVLICLPYFMPYVNLMTSSTFCNSRVIIVIISLSLSLSLHFRTASL